MAANAFPTAVRNLSISLISLIGVIALLLAGATIWLVLADPITVAESFETGEITPLVQSLAAALYDALIGLLRYL